MRTSRRHLFFSWMASLVLLFGVRLGQADQLSKYEWNKIDRVVAIGDVHGAYDKLVSLLRGTGLVDDGLKWTGGDDHLVVVGDLIDRGPDDRKVMELVMRLQKEAGVSGGEVHALVGNHDIMVLMKDLRFVDKTSYADFGRDENPEDREKAWAGYASANSATRLSDPKLKAAFDVTYPPGFFAHLKMFDLEGPFGAWVLTRPIVIKINGIVFVHGGLTEKVAAKGLEEINREIHDNIVAFTKASRTLEPLVKGPATFDEILETAYAIEKGTFEGRKGPEQVEASKAFISSFSSTLMASDSAVWYRGNSLESETIERRRIDDVLNLLKASTLVVGHTPTAEGLVTSRFNARLYRVDVGQGYGRQPYCIEFKANEIRVFDPHTAGYLLPSPEKPQGQQWTAMHPQMTDRQLEEYLRRAGIVATTKVSVEDRQFDIVELNQDNLKLRALFASFDEKPPRGRKEQDVQLRRYSHELAAYWLDRRLKLRMVPVTVIRTVGEKRGALQIWVESAVDRVWLEEQNGLEKAREELREDLDKAWILEALLDVKERAKEGQRVLLEDHRIMLSGSTLAFSHSPEIQEEIKPHLRCPINPSLENELRTLTREELKKSLKDYLSDGQIDTLLKRRDRILELCARSSQ